MNARKLLAKVAASPANTRFGDLVSLVQAVGFKLDRISGSHHVFVHPAVPIPINIQSVGGKAKPYQVRQALKLIERYNLMT
jgi:predicted RNA binding protein YcfA (HicA-like mRNA interferase family)